MSIKYSNIVALLETAAAGKELYVLNAFRDYEGVHITPSLDRFWEDDIITSVRVSRVAKGETEMPKGVYAKSMMALMDIAENVTPVNRYGSKGWELDNAEGRLIIDPAKALRALSEVRSSGILLH